MYSYTFDEETGGILLNSSPTLFSKEPRPVYASEMDLLEFDKYWKYDKQNEIPYLWTESNVFYYKGTVIAKIKGGDLLQHDVMRRLTSPFPKSKYRAGQNCQNNDLALQKYTSN